MQQKVELIAKSLASVELTLGELIETVTRIAQESSQSEGESYELATLVINDLFRQRRARLNQEGSVSF
jgi:hypothetical protein